MTKKITRNETPAPNHHRAARLDRSVRSEPDAVVRSHREVRDADARHRDLLQALPVAAYTTDAAGTIEMFNDAAVALWGRAPERGRRWCGAAELFTPDGVALDREDCPLAITLRERRTQSRVPMIVGRPDGSRRNVHAHPRLLYGRDGAIVGAVNVLVNVSGQCGEEFAQQQDALLATLAHELRNPLAAMRYSLDVLRCDGASPDATDAARGALDRQLTQIVRVLDELLVADRIPASPGIEELGTDERSDAVSDGRSTRVAADVTTAQRPLRVVVADDNEDAAAALEILLGLMGHEVHVAHDGVEAVELADRVQPDAIVLDIGMPRLSGLDACRQIRSHSWSGGVVIVALTGWGQPEDRRRSLDAGFDHHVVKPCNRARLSELLERGRR